MKPQSFTVFDVELRRNEGFSVISKQSAGPIADNLKLLKLFSLCALWFSALQLRSIYEDHLSSFIP
jgi:hypothetical protein